VRAGGPTLVLLFSIFTQGCSSDAPPVGPAKDAASPDTAPPPDTRPPDGATATARKKRIAIDPARVDGDLPAFPVWILLAGDADLQARATTGGADIYFTRPDGTPLAHEIQRWDKAIGRLEAWVRVDLQDTAETVLELRYGDPSVARAPDPKAGFSSSFAAVWHLDDTLATPKVVDATGQRLARADGGLGPADRVAAQLGAGVDFDGATNQISFVNPYAGSADHTISVWINQRPGTGYDSIVTVGVASNNRSRWFNSRYLTGVSAGFFQNDLPGSVSVVEDSGWVLLHWVWNGTTRQSRVYRNGEIRDDRILGAASNTIGADGYLGWAPPAWGPGGATPCGLSGSLDEARLATTPRGGGWITTEFANQSAPQTFYAVGPEQLAP
jgi:hypothetical protein